jgi:hypothetical protein
MINGTTQLRALWQKYAIPETGFKLFKNKDGA